MPAAVLLAVPLSLLGPVAALNGLGIEWRAARKLAGAKTTPPSLHAANPTA
jgi:hypothetical protein